MEGGEGGEGGGARTLDATEPPPAHQSTPTPLAWRVCAHQVSKAVGSWLFHTLLLKGFLYVLGVAGGESRCHGGGGGGGGGGQ